MRIFLRKGLWLVGFCLLLGACVGINSRLEGGIKSFKQQNYRDAFIRLLPLAKRGVADAQYAVGFMYYYGQGVISDKKKALYWIHQSALLGQADGQEAEMILRSTPPSPYSEAENPQKRPL